MTDSAEEPQKTEGGLPWLETIQKLDASVTNLRTEVNNTRAVLRAARIDLLFTCTVLGILLAYTCIKIALK